MAEQKTNPSEHERLRQKAEDLLKKHPSEILLQIAEGEIRRYLHELEIRRIELELQNEELRHSWAVSEISNVKYTELYNFAPSGFFTLDSQGKIHELNVCGAQMLGKESWELEHSSFNRFVSADTKPGFNGFLQRVFETKAKETCEVNLVTGENGSMYVHLSAIALKNEEECHLVAIDITERKLAEDALRTTEDKFSSLIRYSDDPIFSFNPDETYKFVNNAFAKVFRLKPEDFIGKTPHFIFSHEEAEKRLVMVRQVFRTGQKGEIEVRVDAPSGEVFYYLTTVDPIKNEQGTVLFVTCISRNITAGKRAEVELIRAKEQAEERDRLKSVVISGLIEEIRNPAIGILEFVGHLKDNELSGDVKQSYIGEIENAGKVITGIIDRTDINSKNEEE